jgi:hypothetical protein
MFIYWNKRVNNANEPHQWRSSSKRKSTMIINKRNRHMCGMKINMGNVNCHEWVMSNESHHIVGGMLVCQCRVHKSVGSNPYVDRPRPSSPFPKIYTKIVNKHTSPAGKWGRGDENYLETWVKFRIFPICIREQNDVLRHGNG